MGYMRHDAIVVTNWNTEAVRLAHSYAERCGLRPSPVLGPFMNGYASFLIPPDGSKEGWPESDEFDAQRSEWKQLIAENFGDEHRRWVSWVHVSFAGDDPKDTEIVDSDKPSSEED